MAGIQTQVFPGYSLHCTAERGYPDLVGREQSYINHIQSQYPLFRVMHQGIKRGYMVIWPEAKTPRAAADLAGDEELLKQFIELYLLLKR